MQSTVSSTCERRRTPASERSEIARGKAEQTIGRSYVKRRPDSRGSAVSWACQRRDGPTCDSVGWSVFFVCSSGSGRGPLFLTCCSPLEAALPGVPDGPDQEALEGPHPLSPRLPFRRAPSDIDLGRCPRSELGDHDHKQYRVETP